ncbi:MAG: outer membrane lipoprotein-sorting protein [candidate division WOR-3 bacterium]
MKGLKAILPMLLAGNLYGISGNDILIKVDSVMNAPKDRKTLMKMTLIDEKGNEKVRTAESYQKGKDKRLIKFISPADQKGVSFLALPNDVMYVYFPAFRSVRRVASHIKYQEFAGTDLTYNDLGSFGYSKDYNAEIVGEDDVSYILKLTPKPGTDKPYSYLKMWVDKKTFLPQKVEHYDKSGSLWKVMRIEGVKNIKGYNIPYKISVENVKKKHKTIMEFENMEVDVGLSDDIFTVSYMRR